MKSKISNKKAPVREQHKYPWIGIDNGQAGQKDTIILFVDHNYGVVIGENTNKTHKLGKFGAWTEEYYKEYNGEVTLSN